MPDYCGNLHDMPRQAKRSKKSAGHVPLESASRCPS
jgi:hypothetical protein